MPIEYKIKVLDALKNSGYNTNRIRKEKLFSESTLQAFRHNKLVSLDNIARICELLNCNVEDVIVYRPEGAISSSEEYQSSGNPGI